MKLKEKIKNAWNQLHKNWLWINIGAYIIIMIINWTGFFLNFIAFEIAFLITFIYPAIMLTIYYIRKSKHKRIITKIVFVGGLGFVFGGILWFFLGYVLIQAPWAPLRILIGDAVIRGRILLLLLPILCVIAAYVMYRIGKKRDWNFPSY